MIYAAIQRLEMRIARTEQKMHQFEAEIKKARYEIESSPGHK